MSTRGKISELFDLKAIQDQKNTVVGYVDEFVRVTARVKPIKVGLEGADKTRDVLKGVSELGLATREYQKIVDGTSVAQAKLSVLNSEAAKKNAELKIQVQEQNKALRDQAKEALNLGGAYGKLTREYEAAAKEAKDLAAEYGAQSKQAQEASKRALELDARLKAADANVGRFNKNVGNYSGALQTLEKAFEDVKKRLDDINNSGEKNESVVKQLEKEYQLLNQLVNNQANGFASASQELKNNERALQSLGAAGLKNTEFYQQLLKETAELKDNVGDLKQEIKGLASDTSSLDGLIGAAQTLAGAYGIAQGAAALFGSEDKELQKTFVKLQAVLTILNGLQAIQNALQKESSVRLLITTGVQKIQLLQTNLQAAAESRAIVIRYLAIAAQKALNLVMSVAAGPIGIVIGALALLVISLKSFAAGNESAVKSLERLNGQLDVSKSFLDEELNAIKNSNREREAELKKRFATEKEVRDQSIVGQQREIESLKNYEKENADAYDAALSTFKKYHKNHKSVDEDALQQAIEIIDKFENVNRERLNKETEFNVALLEGQRQSAIESAAIERNELQAKIENVNLRADLFKRVASDEFRSYEDRRAALQKLFVIQKEANDLALKQALTNPELKGKPGERALIEAQARAQATQLTRDQNKELSDFDRAERERQRSAAFDFSRQSIQQAAATSQAIVSNEQAAYSDRIIAADNFYQSQKALIELQRDFDLGNEKLNAEERKNVRQKANDDLINLQREYGAQINDLLVAQLDRETLTRINADNKERDEAIKALNDKFNSGKIGIAEYNRRRLELERGYSLESLQITIDQVKKTIALYKSLGYDVGEQEARLAELQKQLSDEVFNKKKDNIEKLRAFEKQVGQEAFDTVVSLVDGAYEQQKNAIQDQIDELDKRKEKEIEVATASIANEQDRANAITNINARANAEKEALQRRQKQYDLEKAKFDKAANIAKIATDTAAAIIAQVKATPPPAGIPFIASVAAIGALQLARAIATPLPRYKYGKDASDPYVGPALVDDGGKPEAIVRKSGEVEIGGSTPRYTWINKGDAVMPDAKQFLMKSAEKTHRNSLIMIQQQPQNDKLERLIERETRKSAQTIVDAILSRPEVFYYMQNGEWRKSVKNGNDTYNYISENVHLNAG